MYMPTLLYKLTWSFILTSALSFFSAASAQENPRDNEMIIKKKGKNDKMVIVIDGDRVVVNGKDVTEQVQANLDMLRSKIDRNMENLSRSLESIQRNFEYAPEAPYPPFPPIPPVPPVAPVPSFDFTTPWADTGWHSKKARLGVYTGPDAKGAKVTGVVEGSPAEKAGLKKDDIIISVDKKDIKDPASLSETIAALQPGDEVTLKYIRDKKQKKVSLTLDQQSNFTTRSFHFQGLGDDMAKGFRGFAETWGKPQLGIRIQDTEEGNGVKVMELEPESLAAKAGIEKDDLITAIDGNEVTNTDDARRRLAALKDRSSYKVQLKRKDEVKEVEVKVPKKLKTADL